jgi:hypothetical protein
MSGPKVIEIDYEALNRARDRNRDKWNSMLARYAAELDGLAGQAKQMVDLGLAALATPPSAKALQKQSERLLEEGEGGGAVNKVEKALSRVRNGLADAQAKVKTRVAELQRRHGGLKSGLLELTRAKASFPKQYDDLMPRSFPAETKQALRQRLQTKLDGLDVPACPELQLNGSGIDALEKTESNFQALMKQMESAREQAFKELNEENARLLTESILKDAEPVQSLSEWLTENQPEAEAPDEKRDKVAEKLNHLLAELVVLKDYPDWETFYGKAEAVREEKSSARRKMLYDGLLIECSRKVKLAKEYEAWSRGLRELQVEAALLESAQGKKFVEELEAVERSGDTAVELRELGERMKAIRAEEKSAGETEKRIKAVLESLKEQGYEVSEEIMEVATVKKGKLVFEKPIALKLPGEEDYAVLVKVVGENRVQTEMVRYDDAEESANQKIRDKEKEETWCSHHARMRKDLEGLGYSIKLKLKKNAGELPVRVVSRDKPKATRRRTAKAPAKRQRRKS